jgi:hypothetical protein
MAQPIELSLRSPQITPPGGDAWVVRRTAGCGNVDAAENRFLGRQRTGSQ